MGDAVCHGIENLAEVGNLIPPSCQNAIEKIGTFANDQKSEEQIGQPHQRNAEPCIFKIKYREKRTYKNAKESNKMSYIHLDLMRVAKGR